MLRITIKQTNHTLVSYNKKFIKTILNYTKEDENNEESVYIYLSKMHPNIAEKYYPKDNKLNTDDIPTIHEIINNDCKLKNIYSSEIFILRLMMSSISSNHK